MSPKDVRTSSLFLLHAAEVIARHPDTDDISKDAVIGAQLAADLLSGLADRLAMEGHGDLAELFTETAQTVAKLPAPRKSQTARMDALN